MSRVRKKCDELQMNGNLAVKDIEKRKKLNLTSAKPIFNNDHNKSEDGHQQRREYH